MDLSCASQFFLLTSGNKGILYIYKQVSWAREVHFDVLNAPVRGKKNKFSDFTKYHGLWSGHVHLSWLLINRSLKKKNINNCCYSYVRDMRNERKISYQVWTNRRAAVAQILYNFNLSEEKYVSQYTVHRSFLCMLLSFCWQDIDPC